MNKVGFLSIIIHVRLIKSLYLVLQARQKDKFQIIKLLVHLPSNLAS